MGYGSQIAEMAEICWIRRRLGYSGCIQLVESDPMRKIAIPVLLTLTLAACFSQPVQPTAQMQQLQDRCSAGDMTACSDLAHLVKAQ